MTFGHGTSRSKAVGVSLSVFVSQQHIAVETESSLGVCYKVSSLTILNMTPIPTAATVVRLLRSGSH